MRGLGKTLVFDIASRISELSIKETKGYTDMLRKVSKIMAAGCDNCVIGWAGINKCPDSVYQRRGEKDGPCEKLIYQYLTAVKS
jgi:hypothetical protein